MFYAGSYVKYVIVLHTFYQLLRNVFSKIARDSFESIYTKWKYNVCRVVFTQEFLVKETRALYLVLFDKSLWKKRLKNYKIL